MTLGKLITQARKRRKITLEELGAEIGMSKANLSVIENGGHKGGTDPTVLIRIAHAVGDLSILSNFCDACPIRSEIFIKKFPRLNNINTDPTVIALKVKQELAEGIDAINPLLERMLSRDFASDPDYQQVLEQSMVQIIGTARALEVLKEQYMLANILTPDKLREIINRQQEHCERQGHHIIELPADRGADEA